MRPGNSGQLVFHLCDGKTVSERQVARDNRSLLSLFPNQITINEDIYNCFETLEEKKITAVSFYYESRIYTITSKSLFDKNITFLFGEKTDKNEKILAKSIGLNMDDYAIIKTISLADSSETTRIVRR